MVTFGYMGTRSSIIIPQKCNKMAEIHKDEEMQKIQWEDLSRKMDTKYLKVWENI